jgi:excisionase family DNA binding protein
MNQVHAVNEDIETGLPVKPDWRYRACYTLAEASELLSTPVSQLRKLCRAGELNPVVGLGRKWRLTSEDLERILSKRLRK